MKISDYVKAIRSYLKLTQKDFGNKIGKTRCSIANYETGRAIPPGDILLKIQKLALNLNTSPILKTHNTFFHKLKNFFSRSPHA